MLGKHLPAGQVLAVENAFQSQRLELDVAKFDRPAVELQSDVATADRRRIGVIEHPLAVERHGEMPSFGPHFIAAPITVRRHLLCFLTIHEAAGRKRAYRFVGDVQLVAILGRVRWHQRRSQEDAAIGRAGRAKIDLQQVVAKLAGRGQKPLIARADGNRAFRDFPIRLAAGLPAKFGLAIEQQDPTVGQFFGRKGVRLGGAEQRLLQICQAASDQGSEQETTEHWRCPRSCGVPIERAVGCAGRF